MNLYLLDDLFQSMKQTLPYSLQGYLNVWNEEDYGEEKTASNSEQSDD